MELTLATLLVPSLVPSLVARPLLPPCARQPLSPRVLASPVALHAQTAEAEAVNVLVNAVLQERLWTVGVALPVLVAIISTRTSSGLLD
eukprot:386288-Prymnesium_polylepis.1